MLGVESTKHFALDEYVWFVMYDQSKQIVALFMTRDIS